MKKIIIPIIAAAILGAGAGVTAMIVNRPAVADEEGILPEIKTGRYYLNGDVNSDMYIELTDDYIVTRIGGDSLAKFEEFCRNKGFTEEEVNISAEKHRDDYCTERKYVLSVTGLDSVPYMLVTHYDEEVAANTVDHRIPGSGYKFNGDDTISLSLIGDFILVE